DRLKIWRHESKWLLFPVLTGAQGLHRRLIGCVHGQMIAPQSLHCDHVARTEERRGVCNRVVGYRTAPRIEEHQPWSAHRAGYGLGMKATVRWIMVLAGTVLAHGKRRYGRDGAVIWYILDNGKPRPAVRTVRQGIAIAAIGWLEQFTQAICARGH